MRKTVLIYLLGGFCFLLGGIVKVSAQKYPERRDIRKGNRAYEQGRYDQSETQYMRAAEKNPGSFEAHYNLGNSLYRQGKWEEAEVVYSDIKDAEVSDKNRFDTHFNAGNAMFQQRKLEEALEEYKQALRINPNDMEAKFNLAYVKKLLDKDNDGGGGDSDDDQDNNNDNQDNQGGGDSNPDQGDGESDPDKGDGENQDGGGEDKPDQGDGQPKERPAGMSREEAENLLDAMQGNEDRARDKADEKKAGAVQRSEKNW